MVLAFLIRLGATGNVRRATLGLAVGAAAAGPVVAGPDACTGSGTATITCAGDQSAGVVVGSGGVNANAGKVLQLGTLTKPIAAAGAGVVWDVNSSNNQTTINANIAGGQSITGNSGAGVRLTSTGGPGGVSRALIVNPTTGVASLGGTDGTIYASTIASNGSGGSGDGGSGSGGKGAALAQTYFTFSSTPLAVTAQGDDNSAIRLVSQAGHGGGGAGADGVIASAGNGGGGGAGGSALVNLAPGWTISASGDDAPALSLKTFGGDGGSGGESGVTNGGRGGIGGTGGSVVLANFYEATAGIPVIRTSGATDSPGILMVSQGGNGGTGGAGDSFGNGGGGGAGGFGGQITVEGTAVGTPAVLDIATVGKTSDGLSATTIGGVGGDGGNGSVFGSSGGSGGSSGSTDDVSVNVLGSIATKGAESYGIIAHAIAGHGGDATSGRTLFAASGGSAGSGGDVTVTSGATISTAGDQSPGISALSTGGGGGHGGSGFVAFYTQGGSGGNGGNGGAVTITNSGTVTTSGDDAAALYAQSIGGVGGDGGAAGGYVAFGGRAGNSSAGGKVTVTNTAVLTTGLGNDESPEGDDPTCGVGCSPGILAQSVGGGGGVSGGTADGGSSGGLLISVGGSGGGGGAGGVVAVTNAADISTALSDSDAIMAQSVGGGGGKGGGSVSFDFAGTAAVGGAGGDGGAAADVTVKHQGGSLSTLGDYSRGITAQSIAGGGGSGNFAVAASADAWSSAAVSVGGDGGKGGGAGLVSVSTTMTEETIATGGAWAHGILAQSIGGGGGTGGWAMSATASASLTPSAAIAVSVGGKGGSGGDGAEVDVMNEAAITTTGDQARGIYVQSIGGGGGDAQFAAAGSASGKDSLDVSVSVGGAGGAAGSADFINAANYGTIRTSGDGANGLDFQSIGGSGGSGGTSVSGTLQGDAAATVSLGGAGGAGGVGGELYILNYGAITTTGDKAIGLSAQSVGGGGGRGGIAINGEIQFSTAKKLGVEVGAAVGGTGGNGDAGGFVTVINGGSGAITTGDPSLPEVPQDNAHAIFAQSVGGGGGHGGMAGSFTFGSNQSNSSMQIDAQVAVGGNGGTGSTGGVVQVQNAAALTTWAGQSHGIFAESIGGSGGAGGAGYAGSFEGLSKAESSTVNLEFAIGGAGGSGNDGEEVLVTNTGAISTLGQAHSTGILAHSVGGGGGSGGSAHTLAWNLTYVSKVQGPEEPGGTNVGLQVRVGGNSGAGGDGGEVEVTNSAAITTAGSDSIGIHAYSVGGGGGDAGQASGMYVFPIPGTDRTPLLKSVSISVGGTAEASGSGGKVTVSHSAGAIATAGAGSPGIYASSIGGGGGMGGTGAAGATGTVALGGTGGAAGNGGDVTVKMTGGSITTQGGTVQSTDPNEAIDSSYGIFAQSVGGGGQAGNATFFGIPDSTDGSALGGVTIGIGLGIDLAGGNAGNGGVVNVTADGAIATNGPNAVGVFAQSVGGGGGVSGNVGLGGLGTLSLATLLGSAGGNGSASTATVSQSGGIATKGDGAHGIFAQSSGPKGSGAVSVTVEGSVTAEGADVNGIFAQSVKGATFDSHGQPTSTTGGAPITVTLGSGAVVTGGVAGSNNSAAGIRLKDGTSNTITVAAGATVGSAAGHDGFAIEADEGAETVTIAGTAIGGIDLGNGTDSLTIASGGRVEPGTTLNAETVNLDAGGTLSPGGSATVATTTLGGKLGLSSGQSANGTLEVTLDAGAGKADRIEASSAAVKGGTVTVETIDIGQGGEESRLSILTASSLQIAQPFTVTPSAVGQFSLATTSTSIDLVYDIDFAATADALGQNERSLSLYMARLHAAGVLDDDFAYLLRARDPAAYGRLLAPLLPAPYAATGSIALGAADRLTDRLMSCRERAGAHRFVAEGRCLRLDLLGARTEQDASDNIPGFTVRSSGVAIGGQGKVAEDIELGFNLAYEPYSAEADGGTWHSSADQIVLGAVLKHQIGDTALSLALGGGWAEVDTRRETGAAGTARGTQDTRFLSVVGRVAHAFVSGRHYVKPRLDVDIVRVATDGTEETGAGFANLTVGASTRTSIALSPAVEVGGEFGDPAGTLFRPRVSLGLTRYLDDPAMVVDARFAGAPPTAGGFTFADDAARTRFNLEAGIDVLSVRGIDLRLNAAAQWDNQSVSYAGFAGLSYAF